MADWLRHFCPGLISLFFPDFKKKFGKSFRFLNAHESYVRYLSFYQVFFTALAFSWFESQASGLTFSIVESCSRKRLASERIQLQRRTIFIYSNLEIQFSVLCRNGQKKKPKRQLWKNFEIGVLHGGPKRVKWRGFVFFCAKMGWYPVSLVKI